MALNLNKLFVRVPSTASATTDQIKTLSQLTGNDKKVYFVEATNEIVVNGVVYGVDPSTVEKISDLQTLVGAEKITDAAALGHSVIERLQALEAIKVKAGDTYNDSSYITVDTSVNADGTSTPVLNLNIVAIDSNQNGLVDAINAQEYIDRKAAATTTIVEAGEGINVTKSVDDVDGHTTYTIDSSLSLEYVAAVTLGTPKNAHIKLTDGNGNSFGEIDVNNIIGNGILKDSSYNTTTGELTLTFAEADGTDKNIIVDLAAMLDINDMSVIPASQKYLTVDLTGGENSQAVFTVHTVDVSTVTDQTTALADAWQVKQYVDAKVSDKNVSATGDNYITANAANNEVTITADVQNLTASAGTRGTYTVANDGTVTLSGETAPSISGVSESLVDGADVATKVATYVDAKVAAEAARTNANIDGAVKALDAEVTSNDGDNVTVKVTEVDGVITAVNVTDTYATVDSSLGVTDNTGLVVGSDIEKVKTYVDSVVQESSVSAHGDNYVNAAVDPNNVKQINVSTNVGNLNVNSQTGQDSSLGGVPNTLVDGEQAAGVITTFVNTRISEEVAKLDSNTSATNTYVTTSTTMADGALTDSSVTLTFGSMDGQTAGNVTNGIAKAEDVQDFVDTYDFWETYTTSNNNNGGN